MRHSLADRFRGTLLGAVLGETLGRVRLTDRPSHHTKVLLPQTYQFSGLGWGELAIDLTQRLLQTHPPESWASPPLPSLSASALSSSGSNEVWILALLPLILLYHDDRDKLRAALQQSATVWQIPEEQQSSALLFSYTLSLALQEKLDPAALIDRLLADITLLGDRSFTESFTESLGSVQQAVQQAQSLSVASRRLQAASAPLIVPALYCFLSTPTDSRLSMLRALQLPFPTLAMGGMVGALTGAYNGLAGFPAEWRKALNKTAIIKAMPQQSMQQSMPQSSMTASQSLSAAPELVQLVDQLLALWAGVHRPQQIARSQIRVTASPQSLRPRS